MGASTRGDSNPIVGAAVFAVVFFVAVAMVTNYHGILNPCARSRARWQARLFGEDSTWTEFGVQRAWTRFCAIGVLAIAGVAVLVLAIAR